LRLRVAVRRVRASPPTEPGTDVKSVGSILVAAEGPALAVYTLFEQLLQPIEGTAPWSGLPGGLRACSMGTKFGAIDFPRKRTPGPGRQPGAGPAKQ